MPKKCIKCGASLPDGTKFCTSCGAKVIDSPVPPSNEINQNQANDASQMPPVQSYQNTQMPQQPPKKSNMKLIAIILAVVVAVVVIVAVLIVVFGGAGIGSEESKFVGTWEYSVMGMSVQYKFNSDKSLEVGTMGQLAKVGTWKVENGKLVLSADSQMTGSVSAGTYDYSFSNNGNSLTLTMNGYGITFNKK